MSAVVVVTAHRHHIRSTTVTYYEADVTVVERRVCHRRCSCRCCCRRIIVPYYEADVTVVERRVCHRRCSCRCCCRRIIAPHYGADVTVVKRRVCHRCCSCSCRRIIVSYYEAAITAISFTCFAYPTARQVLLLFEKGPCFTLPV